MLLIIGLIFATMAAVTAAAIIGNRHYWKMQDYWSKHNG